MLPEVYIRAASPGLFGPETGGILYCIFLFLLLKEGCSMFSCSLHHPPPPGQCIIINNTSSPPLLYDNTPGQPLKRTETGQIETTSPPGCDFKAIDDCAMVAKKGKQRGCCTVETKWLSVVIIAVVYGFCMGLAYDRIRGMHENGGILFLRNGKVPQRRVRAPCVSVADNTTVDTVCPPCPTIVPVQRSTNPESVGTKKTTPAVTEPHITSPKSSSKNVTAKDAAFARTMFHLQDEMLERQRILMDNVVGISVASIRERSKNPYVSVNPKLSTSVNCYDFGANNLRHRFGKKLGKISGSGMCVFERLCWNSGSGFVAKWSKDDTDEFYPFRTYSKEKDAFDWPPCLTCNTKLTAVEVSGGAFSSDQKWVEEPTYFPVHSYERHVTHFMESITSINAAVHRLTSDQLYGSQAGKIPVVQLVNHPANLFAWQKGVVKVAVRQSNVTIERGAPKDNVCYKRALIPGYVFELFNDGATADDWRRDVYAALKLPPPEIPINDRQLIFAQRKSKRTMVNRELALKLISQIPLLPGVKVKVKNVLQSKLSFLEQVRNMRESRVLVGMHGADLTNCMFLPKGSAMIEINPLNWYDSRFVRMCETAGVNYLSYNVGESTGVKAPYPFAHYPPMQCSFLGKPIIDCKMDQQYRPPSRESNVEVEMDKFLAIVAEAFAIVGWGPRVVYPAFKDDWGLLKVFRWDGKEVLKWEPSLK
jgi:hypothetical protein